MKKINVALLDDHPLILSGLETLISKEEDIHVTGTFQSGAALLKAMEQKLPDVLLLDIHLPEMSGDEIALLITRNYPAVKIIVLSNLDYPYYIKNLIQYGIKGFLLKSSDKGNVILAIRTVFAGEQYIDEEIADKITAYRRSINQMQAHPLLLTKREKEIMQLIAKDYTSQEIADKLFLSKRTIDTHRNSLLLKLDVKNSAGLIKKAMDMGLLK